MMLSANIFDAILASQIIRIAFVVAASAVILMISTGTMIISKREKQHLIDLSLKLGDLTITEQQELRFYKISKLVNSFGMAVLVGSVSVIAVAIILGVINAF